MEELAADGKSRWRIEGLQSPLDAQILANDRVLITEYNQSLGLDEPKRTAALDAWRKSLATNPNQLQVQKLAATYAEKMSEPGK